MIEQWVIDRLNPLKSEDLVKVVQPTKPTTVPMSEGLARVYEILGRRHSSGHTDAAERHNEHQP
jgi:hypothetical protein